MPHCFVCNMDYPDNGVHFCGGFPTVGFVSPGNPSLTPTMQTCAFCSRIFPKEDSLPFNMMCAACRQAGHARVEAENKTLREENERLRKEVAELTTKLAEIGEREGKWTC
jgi:hypothetical protein